MPENKNQPKEKVQEFRNHLRDVQPPKARGQADNGTRNNDNKKTK
ncbi:hypothetical protein Dip518_000636 [Parelusimicrobium proximum]